MTDLIMWSKKSTLVSAAVENVLTAANQDILNQWEPFDEGDKRRVHSQNGYQNTDGIALQFPPIPHGLWILGSGYQELCWSIISISRDTMGVTHICQLYISKPKRALGHFEAL